MKIDIIGNVIDIYNDNIDVQVEINGKMYVATFFTISNIRQIMSTYKSSGECLNGKYFWASDMIIVDNLEENEIRKVITHLVDNGEISSAFHMIQ